MKGFNPPTVRGFNEGVQPPYSEGTQMKGIFSMFYIV